MQEQQAKQAPKSTPQGTGAGITTPPAAGAGGPVSEDLVRKVAERVYALLMAELRLDFERQRIAAPGRRGSRMRQGGRL